MSNFEKKLERSHLEEEIKIEELMENINEKLKDMEARIENAKPSDLKSILESLKVQEDLGYDKKSIEALLKQPEAINFLIKDKNGKVLSFILGYPAREYYNVQKNMPWKLNGDCPELKDKEAFYGEVTATLPDHQKEGLYKILSNLRNLAAYKAGFKTVFAHSIPESIEIYKKLGWENIRKLPQYWVMEDADPKEVEEGVYDAFLMKTELTDERIEKYFKNIRS